MFRLFGYAGTGKTTLARRIAEDVDGTVVYGAFTGKAAQVLRSPELRAEVTLDVARFAQSLGLSVRGATASPLPGPSGNVEYFLWLVKDGGEQQLDDTALTALVNRAIEEGPM